MGDTIFHFKGSEKPIVVFDAVHLPHMVVGMMSSVIEWLEHQRISHDDFHDVDCSHSIRYAREEIKDWADHGFTNTVLMQAQFVFDFFEAATKDNDDVFVIFGSRGMFTLFIRMTEAIQNWRDRVRERDQKIHGPNWGSALKLYSFDWCQLNEHIRTKYNIK